MTYEKKSVIELREIAKERKIKGISTLKKKELIEVLENYDQEQSKQKEEPQIQREPKQSYSEHQERKHQHDSLDCITRADLDIERVEIEFMGDIGIILL